MEASTVDAATLRDELPALCVPADVAHARSMAIHAALVSGSRHVREGNFTVIGSDDLTRLFTLYDEAFFQGRLRKLVDAQASGRLSFRLSKRMTKVGGTTSRQERRLPGVAQRQAHYEIAISTTLLFQTFGEIERPVRVNGVECRDRLEAMQRVFEHELVHLLEMLVWGDSSCTAANFKRLALGLFAHTDVTHQLVTARERAFTQFQVQVGDQVFFEFEGTRHVGMVNRITRRATVLVESPGGVPYSDGKRYAKFYIPLAMLRKADS